MTSGLSIGLFFTSPIPIQYTEEYNHPNSSADEFTIITPETKTYTEPMSGYYPATHGFESDGAGDDPLFCTVEEIGGEVNVVDSIGGHNKVVAVIDNSASDFPYFYNTFEVPQSYGTYEFWVRTTDASNFQGLRLYSGPVIDSNVMIDFVIDSEKFRNYDGTWHDVADCVDNQWYHIEIAYECTTGSYRGLNQYKFKVWIDNDEYGEFGWWYTKPNADKIQFMGGNSEVQTLYIDAIGYSWDPNYNIGDNLNESLLLSYDSITTLDWQGYSLDGQENVTILGNTTLPALSNGLHSAQLHGNRSIINDLSTNITGSKYGDPQWVSGKIGTYAIDFDGNGDYFSLDKTLEIGTISHTISMWVKVSSSIPDDQRVGIMLGNWVDFSSNDYCNWEIYTYGRIRFCWYGTCFLGTSDLRDDNWHLITYVRDKTANKVFIYLDDQIEFIIDSAQPDVSLGSRPTHCIGKDRRGGTQVYFNGLIDEFRIFNEILKAEEVEWLYNGGLGRTESLTINQGSYEVNWWKFEEGSGNNIFDSFTDINTTFYYQSDLVYFTVSFNNYIEPELTNGNVLPRIGDQTTEFNFTVIFRDEDDNVPSYVNVVINGTAHAMEKTFPFDDNYTDGCFYEYTTFLLPSEYNYTYYFECSDGKFANTTTAFNDLTVNKVNYNSPQLLFPEVSPGYGGLTTDFVFNIWYYDLDDNYPLEVNVTIDTSTFSMSQVNSGDTNATDGIEFYYTTNLDTGTHTFRFNCSDGIYSNSTNWIIGPEVNPLYGIGLELLTPSSYSNIYSNLVDFSWTSLNFGFGAVNFTLQVSNFTDFSHIIYQSVDIAETPIITNLSVPLSI
ncbi:MAG: LamG-like jellyroll fold domain-containing protein, partial [Promethearchaeota archaeon]